MAPPGFLSPYRRGTVVLVLLLGIGLSLFTWRYAVRQNTELVRTEFLSRAQTQASVASLRLRDYQEMVYSLRDAFIGQNDVSRKEFSNVARSLLERHQGVQALQWTQIIPQAQRDDLERRFSQDLGVPYVIRQRQPDNTFLPAGPAAEYFAIAYIEPLAGNEPALGYDLLSAPTAPLLTAARTDRQFKVSRTLRLAQSRPGQVEPGVIFILPFWRVDQPDSPVEGFVQGVFQVQTMLAQSHQLMTNEALDTYYLETDGPDGRSELLYANLAGFEPLRSAAGPVALPRLDDPDDLHTTLALGGRTWRMIIRPNADWFEATRSNQPLAILIAGLLLTGFITGFVNSLFVRTASIEREVAERTRELRATEARLQDIVDHSPLIIYLKDPDGRYLLCNRTFMHNCGRTRDEILGRRDEELFPATDALSYRLNDAKVMAAGRALEFEEQANDPAHPRTYLTHKFPLLDEQGRAYALCGISTDISDRKAAEHQRLALERKLLESQKLESLGVLAGGIAHDFNNILTAILGNAALAALDLPETHRGRKQLQQIERSANRAADLCAQMLAYAGRASFVTTPVSLTALVRDTASLLEVSVGKRVRLELLTHDPVPAVMGDATQLRQIVMNLVINSADAMGDRTDGHVIVRTFARDLAADYFLAAVQAPSLSAGRYVCVEVSDNGSGMPPEVQARIFEPFYSTKFSGRGLGLAAVLGIVQSHEGALFVESTPGQGTVFRLFLPVTAAPTQGSTPPFAPAPASFRGTVLVVDDEEPVRQVAREALIRLGLNVLEAPDGATALDLARGAATIDLVLLDLTMPGLAGDETLRQLRQIRPELRVVIMSGYSEGETMQRCASLGVTGCLPKPFEITALTEILRPHLG